MENRGLKNREFFSK
jgi:hypothetical protein